ILSTIAAHAARSRRIPVTESKLWHVAPQARRSTTFAGPSGKVTGGPGCALGRSARDTTIGAFGALVSPSANAIRLSLGVPPKYPPPPPAIIATYCLPSLPR